jgi:hypothetical protein
MSNVIKLPTREPPKPEDEWLYRLDIYRSPEGVIFHQGVDASSKWLEIETGNMTVAQRTRELARIVIAAGCSIRNDAGKFALPEERLLDEAAAGLYAAENDKERLRERIEELEGAKANERERCAAIAVHMAQTEAQHAEQSPAWVANEIARRIRSLPSTGGG